MASSGSFNTSAYGSGNYNRYLNFSWSVQSQSVSGNSTTISYTLKGAGGNTTSYVMSGPFKLVIDGKTVYSSSSRIQLKNGTVLKTGTFTMTHNSSGARSFSASAEAAIYYASVNCKGSGSWSLPSIPRAATISKATNFNDTGNPTITYSNPAGNSVTSLNAGIFLDGYTAVASYRAISKTGTSYTFNLTDAERNAIRAAMPNSNTRTLRFYVQTVIGGQTYLNYTTATVTIVNGNPTFTAAYQDTNSAVVAVTGNNQLIVQNKSTLQINVTNAAAYKSASLTTATCVLNGTTYSGNISNNSYTFNIGTLDISSNATATITVADSRGNKTSQDLTIQMIAYSAPSAIITYERANNFYSATTINVDAEYASVNGANSVTIQVRYKKTTDTTWSSYVTFQDNVSQTLTLDNNYAWDLQTVITDLYSTVTYNQIVSRGMPIVYFDRLKNSVGFNCFPLDEDSVEANNVPLNRNIATCGLTSTISSVTANAYTDVDLNKSLITGSRLTFSSGGIIIGKGVGKVLVSGQMIIQATSKAAVRYFRIIRNNDATKVITWICGTAPAGSQYPLILTPALGEVEEGDVITMQYYTTASDDQIVSSQMSSANYGTRTNMTIEVVG